MEDEVGLIVGKGGETIKNMQASTGARIQVIHLHLLPGDTSTERTLKIEGTSEQIESAKQLVNQVISGEDVTTTKGNEFEDYFLKRELLWEYMRRVLKSLLLSKKKAFQLLSLVMTFLPGLKIE